MRVLNDFGRPQLGIRPRLGYAQGSPEEAALSFALSAKAFEGVSGWSIPDADWVGSASEIARRSDIEVKNLEKNVIGKLGNAEAEEAAALLYENWKSQRDFGLDALKNPPGWWDQTRAKISQFWSDFKGGAAEAWQEYSDVAISMSGPVLKSYWNSVSRINVLKKDLEEATASGNVADDVLAAQGAKISAVEAKVESIRNLYGTVSFGGSLDKIAQGEHGPYELGAPIPVGWVIAIVAISAAVIALAYGVGSIEKISGFFRDSFSSFLAWLEKPGNKKTAGVVSVAVVAVILVPYVLKD